MQVIAIAPCLIAEFLFLFCYERFAFAVVLVVDTGDDTASPEKQALPSADEVLDVSPVKGQILTTHSVRLTQLLEEIYGLLFSARDSVTRTERMASKF